MPIKFAYMAMIIMAVLLLAACNAVDKTVNSNPQKPVNSTIGPETMYADGARRISIGELETLMKDGQAFVVDVRDKDSYEQGHIPGSHLIPAGEILNHLNELPHDKMIVTYCS